MVKYVYIYMSYYHSKPFLLVNHVILLKCCVVRMYYNK